MELVLSLQKEAHDALMSKAAIAIALEGYRDLKNSYGFAMRNDELLHIKNMVALIHKIDITPLGECLLFNLTDTITLVTSFDIAQKLLSSHEPYRFVHAFKNDKPKRKQFKDSMLQFCKEMIEDLSSQAIFRYEVDIRKTKLKEYNYD